MFDYYVGMDTDQLAAPEELLQGAAELLSDLDPAATDQELIDRLRFVAEVERAAQRCAVTTLAVLTQRGVFAARGQRPDTALVDLLGLEPVEARRVVTAAEHVCPRTDLQGQQLPARLPVTAEAFHAGRAGLRQVEVIARLMTSPPATRLDPATWAGAEAQLAERVDDYTPSQLRTWGTQLLELLDQDGPEPEDPTPGDGNELLFGRDRRGNGGWLKARYTDAAMYDLIATLIDAKATPLTTDDHRPLGQRQADALAELLGWVADHGDTTVTPAAGGRRPHINVLVRLEDLEGRARAAVLDFGGVLTPTELRLLCCDACIVPIVMNGNGQPLDVGRASRTIPDGLRRAVATRDRGCAHPGCTRPPSWCQVHHIIPWELGSETKLVNLVMLCRLHHREIHSSGWGVRIAPDGQPEFLPPAWVDPQRRPRRNPAGHPSGERSP